MYFKGVKGCLMLIFNLFSVALTAVADPFVIRIDRFETADPSTSVIPFTRAGNLILIRAKADTTSGFFVIDTGTPNLVLNITYFRRYPTSNPTESGGITGEVAGATQTRVDSLIAGNVHYYRLDADLVNLGHIENEKGVKILGALGMKLFEGFEVMFDFDQQLMYLRQVKGKDPAGDADPLFSDSTGMRTIPIDLDGDKTIVDVVLHGKKLKFVVDSGAETSVLDSRLPNKVYESVVITRRRQLSGMGTTRVEALYGELHGLQIGNLTIPSMPILVTNLQSMCDAYNNCIDGMLGFDFLSLHKIGFNFVTRKMYIWN